MPDLTNMLYYLVAVVIAITIHEFFHAWIALELGDPTAKYMGRISLNPVAHFDPMGFLMILFLSFGGRGLGWGKPVPVNPNNLRNGPIVGGAMVSAAGPLSNLLVAALVAIPLRLIINGMIPNGALPDSVVLFMAILFRTSVGLAIFNLLPIPPLDGYDFWMGILHQLPFSGTHQLWMSLSGDAIRQYGPVIMLVLVFWAQGILWRIMDPPIRFVVSVFLGSSAGF
jgi:Zn-dependent protease